jgi:cyclase
VPLTVLGGRGLTGAYWRFAGACGVIGAAAGSLFVFKGQYRAVLISYPTPQQKIYCAVRHSAFCKKIELNYVC